MNGATLVVSIGVGICFCTEPNPEDTRVYGNLGLEPVLLAFRIAGSIQLCGGVEWFLFDIPSISGLTSDTFLVPTLMWELI